VVFDSSNFLVDLA